MTEDDKQAAERVAQAEQADAPTPLTQVVWIVLTLLFVAGVMLALIGGG